MPGYAREEADLLPFIKNHSWKDIKTNTAKDEEFQILVSMATEDSIKALRALTDSKTASSDDKILAIRALGLLKDKNSSAFITDLLLNSKTPLIVYMSAWSLINIGGERNYFFVTENFQRIKSLMKDDDLTYSLLIDLAYNYKTKPALKLMADYLDVTPLNIYKPVFLFTVYGKNLDSEQILNYYVNSKDKNIRLNAIQILGRWYATPNAVFPFELILKTETDTDIRNAIIVGLKKIATKQAVALLSHIASNGINEKEKAYARAALEHVNKLTGQAKKEKQSGNAPQFSKFKEEYFKLMSSKGYDGSYIQLEKNAQFKDIPRLETLRETIMLNVSENATINYDKVTDIITKLYIQNEQ